MNVLSILTSFVEGKLPAKDFEQYLSSPDVKKILDKYPSPPYADLYGDLYTFIASKNFSRLSDIYEVQTLLIDVLTKEGISVIPSQEFKKNYELLLDVQPQWLDIQESFLVKLIEQSSGKSGGELKKFLKDSIKEKFKYLTKKPLWLQSPSWPIVDGEPLVFVGQIDISEIMCTKSYVYVFFNASDRTSITIVQNM